MEGVDGLMNELTFYKGKKVFVTGHTGFKGSWLSKILLMAGADVCGYALEPEKGQNLFSIAGLSEEMRSIIGDVRDLAYLKKSITSFNPDIVFHLAAQPIVRSSYENPVYTYETNVMGTVHLLESVRHCPAVRSLVNVTTDKVYLNKEWAWGYRENDILDGYDPYSNSKSCSELVTSSFKKSFLNDLDIAVSTARAGNVIGGGDFARDRIIPDCIRAALQDEHIIVRNPNSTRPYQHVLEPVFAYLLIAEKQDANRELAGNYNIGPDDRDCVTTGTLVDLFCRLWGPDAGWESKTSSGPHEANFLKLDCSKAKAALGWQPKWNIETAVAKTIEWTKSYANHENIRQIMQKQITEYAGES